MKTYTKQDLLRAQNKAVEMMIRNPLPPGAMEADRFEAILTFRSCVGILMDTLKLIDLEVQDLDFPNTTEKSGCYEEMYKFYHGGEQK